MDLPKPSLQKCKDDAWLYSYLFAGKMSYLSGNPYFQAYGKGSGQRNYIQLCMAKTF